jgi:outer membrane protein OmpA-like peptidoglycan-associated protein
LQAKGYGEKKPLVPNTSDSARQKNRRTVFVVL